MSRVKIKHEQVFSSLSPVKAEPTEEGRRQFFIHQSSGRKPTNPNAYYECLTRGKEQADWLTEEYRRLFFSGEWWGLLQLWKDWEGSRFVLSYLLSWYKELPEWVVTETRPPIPM